jgi:NNP family nitrate/nitrite transporter-like MFS transporter
VGLSIITKQKDQANSILAANTLAFTACFAVWLMFSIIGIEIKDIINLSETEFGLMVATPILTGSILRLPLGMLTDKVGGRRVFIGLMMTMIAPLWFISEATEYWHFLILGLFVGVAGASFSVGNAYTVKWFDQSHQGFAMGIFGAGNAGAAITKFIAPALIIAYGTWTVVPKFFAVAMVIVIVAYWMFTYEDPAHKLSSNVGIKEQLKALNDPKLWKYMQYYSLVFGGFVALSLWMTKYYINEYGFGLQTAALLATIFVLPAGIVRALGGWFADKYGAYKVTWLVMWVSLICLFFLSYPQTSLIIKTTTGETSLDLSLNVWVFTGILFILGVAWGLGKASVFKFLSDEYPDNIGTASGAVGLAGGLAGFLLPIMFGALIDYTHINSSIFMLLYGATAVSLIWMHFTFGKEQRDKGILKAKNDAFNKYTETRNSPEDVISARAVLEQMDLIEEFNERYNAFKANAKKGNN